MSKLVSVVTALNPSGGPLIATVPSVDSSGNPTEIQVIALADPTTGNVSFLDADFNLQVKSRAAVKSIGSNVVFCPDDYAHTFAYTADGNVATDSIAAVGPTNIPVVRTYTYNANGQRIGDSGWVG